MKTSVFGRFGRDYGHLALLGVLALAMTAGLACDGTGTDDSTCTACWCDQDYCTDGGDADGDTDVQYCAELQVNSEPPGANISVNGAIKECLTPCALRDISVGSHITISMDGREPSPGVTVTTACVPVNGNLYPIVDGEWALTYRESTTGAEGHYPLDFEQDGRALTGVEDDCNYTGEISTWNYISLRRDCSRYDRTVTGNLVTPTHLQGNWYDDSGSSGTWWADRP